MFRFLRFGIKCRNGCIYNHSAEPINDFFTPAGDILYQ